MKVDVSQKELADVRRQFLLFQVQSCKCGLFLSAAKGQRPMNYLSCCSWIFRYQLPYVKLSTYKSINTSNNQYSIAADPGAGIGLVK